MLMTFTQEHILMEPAQVPSHAQQHAQHQLKTRQESRSYEHAAQHKGRDTLAPVWRRPQKLQATLCSLSWASNSA